MSTDKKYYIDKKRKKIDNCNICGKISELTRDHVPPKATLLSESIDAYSLFGQDVMQHKKMQHFQNGIKYRSICANCNNVVLGENDKVYKEFSEKCVNDLSRMLDDPSSERVICVDVKINRLLRAVCGHLLAMKMQYEENALPDVMMREYVLDSTLRMEGFSIFAWVYLYDTVLNSRDFTVASRNANTHPKGMVSIMSSFPIAYLISEDDESNCGLVDLGKHTTQDIDEKARIQIPTYTALLPGSIVRKPFDWPANVNDNKNGALAVLGGDAFMTSYLGFNQS